VNWDVTQLLYEALIQVEKKGDSASCIGGEGEVFCKDLIDEISLDNEDGSQTHKTMSDVTAIKIGLKMPTK